MTPGAKVKREHVGMTSTRAGRPPVTTRVELEQVALELFADHGFEATTVDDIAASAGISRRTFFRYYDSKNDVVWGDFDSLLGRMAQWLAATADEVPLVDALRAAVIQFNAVPPELEPAHRERMALILRVPALQAHSTLRYEAWRGVVATFAARRLDRPVDSFGPQLVGHLALGAAVAAYEQWLGDEEADLGALLADAFALLPGDEALRRAL
jgi:mycofactocin system transcriptional regulator